MKKLLYTLLALSIIFSACEKEDEEPTIISSLVIVIKEVLYFIWMEMEED